MSGNYSFIEYLEPKDYNESGKLYSGKISLKLKTLTPLFIGSGFEELKGDMVYKSFIKYKENYVIPGSSLKGALRTNCQTVSYSCIEVDRNKIRDLRYKKDKNCDCIVCKVFGKMGVKSKIRVGEFLLSEKNSRSVSDIINIKELFSPNNDNREIYYEKGKLKGIKVYPIKNFVKTGEEKIPVETVNKDVVFQGDIYFEDLDLNELSLICFGLGLDDSYNMKLGGNKANGFGYIKFEEFKVLGVNELDLKDLAQKYGAKDKLIEINKAKLREFYKF